MPHIQAKQTLVALAVNDLSKSNDFDSITVDMICERAQVSRSAFYRMFDGKYSVLDWCERFPVERGLGEMGRTLTIEQGIEVTFKGFDLFWDMFESVGRSPHGFQRRNLSVRRAHELVCETISEYHGVAIDARLNYQVLWSVRGTLAAIMERRDLRGNDVHSAAELVAACYPQRLIKILDKPTAPTSQTSLDINTLLLD